mmetsp:Transcript_83635/g.264063  ORF Transcript_83635/g.264063 Transcript_83635/m.264063 type:complete len:182 (+) Transcript_83635:91-636(+)
MLPGGPDAPRPTREWREIRETLEVHRPGSGFPLDPTAESRVVTSVRSSATSAAAAQAASALPGGSTKAPYPRLLPPPEPPLARFLPDPNEPWAPLRLAALWGGLGAGLGALRGAAFAAFSEVRPGFPRHRAFLMGFSLSTPWYVSFFVLAALTDCYAARWQRPRILDSAQAAGALGAGELG